MTDQSMMRMPWLASTFTGKFALVIWPSCIFIWLSLQAAYTNITYYILSDFINRPVEMPTLMDRSSSDSADKIPCLPLVVPANKDGLLLRHKLLPSTLERSVISLLLLHVITMVHRQPKRLFMLSSLGKTCMLISIQPKVSPQMMLQGRHRQQVSSEVNSSPNTHQLLALEGRLKKKMSMRMICQVAARSKGHHLLESLSLLFPCLELTSPSKTASDEPCMLFVRCLR